MKVKPVRPEITKAEWKDTEGKTAGKGLVGEPLKLVAETKDMEEGSGVTFTVYEEKSGKKVAETGATEKDGKAEAQWWTIDTRPVNDKKELRYIFEITGNRCKKIKSGEIHIKNPRIISMEWDKKAIYYGDKATLKIKTFELCDENPVCKLQLWEKDFTTEDDFILEQDITINSDEVETEIKFDFDVEQVLDEELDGELEVFCRLIYKGTDKASKINSKLVVRTQGVKR